MEVKFQGTVTDAGQYAASMTITYDKEIVSSSVNKDTYEVFMTSVCDYGEMKGMAYPYYDAQKPLEIVKTEVKGNIVKVYFRQDQACTSTWLKEGRNYPAVLHFEISQKNPLTVITMTPDQRKLESQETYEYTCSVSSWKDLEDEEIAQFEAVNVENGISYQLHKGSVKKLIVWLHGNGEGDFEEDGKIKCTGNNISQILCNRGGTAWLSKEAVEAFGDAYIAAFQAPSVWYYAVKNDHALLKLLKLEIDEIIETYDINQEDVYLAGCSAGGYMCVRMIIDYPGLFRSAMITCPALDIANLRSGTDYAVPSDEELSSIRQSVTRIWLVQSRTDSVVDPQKCAVRIWNILSKDRTVTWKDYVQKDGISSGFTTYETEDDKYKMTLYDTVDIHDVAGPLGDSRKGGQIVCAEDYDCDGIYEPVKYNDHWSWIFTLRNQPQSEDGRHLFDWAAGRNILTETSNEEENTENREPSAKDTLILVLAAAAGFALGFFSASVFVKRKSK